jgi:hypothetical protein
MSLKFIEFDSLQWKKRMLVSLSGLANLFLAQFVVNTPIVNLKIGGLFLNPEGFGVWQSVSC